MPHGRKPFAHPGVLLGRPPPRGTKGEHEAATGAVVDASAVWGEDGF